MKENEIKVKFVKKYFEKLCCIIGVHPDNVKTYNEYIISELRKNGIKPQVCVVACC